MGLQNILKLKHDVCTRWNRTLVMMEMLLDQLPYESTHFRALSHDLKLAEKLNFMLSHPIQSQYAFDFSSTKDSIFVQGVKTLAKHIYKQIQVHENSTVHNEAVYAYMQAKKTKDISALININQRDVHLMQVSE